MKIAVLINGEKHPIPDKIVERYYLESGMHTAAGWPIVEM
jgi:hypothetical protein